MEWQAAPILDADAAMTAPRPVRDEQRAESGLLSVRDLHELVDASGGCVRGDGHQKPGVMRLQLHAQDVEELDLHGPAQPTSRVTPQHETAMGHLVGPERPELEGPSEAERQLPLFVVPPRRSDSMAVSRPVGCADGPALRCPEGRPRTGSGPGLGARWRRPPWRAHGQPSVRERTGLRRITPLRRGFACRASLGTARPAPRRRRRRQPTVRRGTGRLRPRREAERRYRGGGVWSISTTPAPVASPVPGAHHPPTPQVRVPAWTTPICLFPWQPGALARSPPLGGSR